MSAGQDLTRTEFKTNIQNLMNSVEALKLYPCAKAAVEYVGERSDPILDRVQ